MAERTKENKAARFRHIGWPEYGSLVDRLTEKIRSGGKAFDLVIGIARGGIPGAMVIADDLGVKIDFINVKSYDGPEREEPRIISTITESVRDKNVLVVDDLVDDGDTLAVVREHLVKEEPKSISTAVLFRKPWSKVEPDYCLEVTDRWIVFPWERGELRRSFGKTLGQTTGDGLYNAILKALHRFNNRDKTH